MSASGYLQHAEKKLAEGDCRAAVYDYSTAILADSLNKDIRSREVDQAIAALHATAPGCASDPRYVMEYVQSGAQRLNEERPDDAVAMLDLLFSLADRYPQTYLELSPFGVLGFLDKRGDDARWQRAYALLLDRGVWEAKDVDYVQQYGMDRQRGNTDAQAALARLRQQLETAAAYAAKATGNRCQGMLSLRYCNFSSVSADVIAYQTAFAAGLESAGLAGSNRVATVRALSRNTAVELARDQERRQAVEARMQADSASNNALLGMFAAVAGVAVQTSAVNTAAKAPATRTSANANAAAVRSAAAAGALASNAAPTSTTSASAARMAAATGANKPATATAAAGNPKDPFRYSPGVNECISIKPRPNTQATETITNSCGFAVNLVFCTEGTVAAGDFKGRQIRDCSKRVMGGAALEAGQSDTWNYMTRGVVTRFVACRKPFYLPSTKLEWRADGGFTGQCQASP